MKNKLWTLIRISTFILVGLMNTILIRPEDVGSWKNYVGYILLIIATVDLSLLFIKPLKKKTGNNL